MSDAKFMNDDDKTKEQLINELRDLRSQIDELKQSSSELIAGVTEHTTEHMIEIDQNILLASFSKESPNPILSTDLEGNIIYLNPTAQRIADELCIDINKQFLPDDHRSLPGQFPESLPWIECCLPEFRANPNQFHYWSHSCYPQLHKRPVNWRCWKG